MKSIFSGCKILGWQFFSLSTFQMFLLPSGLHGSWWETHGSPAYDYFSLDAFRIFLSFLFLSLIMTCAGVDFFKFILFWVYQAWMYKFMSFIKFEKFLAITSAS